MAYSGVRKISQKPRFSHQVSLVRMASMAFLKPVTSKGVGITMLARTDQDSFPVVEMLTWENILIPREGIRTLQ